jgi:PKD repeat protein
VAHLILFRHLTSSGSPENPIIDEIITFNASSSYENIIKYDWDFGDGTTAGGETATHSYSSAGEYNVTLTVTHDGYETDTITKVLFVGISRWLYDATVKEHGEETKTGVLTMTFMGWEHVGGYNASVFYVANKVPEEPSNYEIILANTGDFMEKYVTEDQSYAKLLPINPHEDWQEGVSLLTNTRIKQATPYSITGVEDIEVPAGNFRCYHVKARFDVSFGNWEYWGYINEWWDDEGRGLIQAKYNKGGLTHGGSSDTTWEYKLANFTDSLFPINYMGIENMTVVSRYTTNPPNIDGIIRAGEWTNMMPITLNGYINPQNTLTGELYVMNDNNDIYIAVVIPDDNPDADYLLLDFDLGNDHVATNGDEDAIGFDLNRFYPRFPVGYTDLHWAAGWWDEDANAHGNGAQSYEPAHPGVPGEYWYVFTKPLKSGDTQDMALNVGDTVGFRIEVRDGTTGDWYRFPMNTADADTSLWSEWADLVIVEP